MLIAGGALLLGGSAANCLLARPAEQPSDLTLANIEALAGIQDGDNVGGDARWIVTPLDKYGSKKCDPGGSDYCTF